MPVIVPGVSSVKKKKLSELDREGLDTVIYVADRRQQDAVASDAAMTRRMKGHWLWSVVLRLWPTWLYVTRGTGFWGPAVRVGSPPEVTVLTLRARRAP